MKKKKQKKNRAKWAGPSVGILQATRRRTIANERYIGFALVGLGLLIVTYLGRNMLLRYGGDSGHSCGPSVGPASQAPAALAGPRCFSPGSAARMAETDVAAASLFGADRRLCSADVLSPPEVGQTSFRSYPHFPRRPASPLPLNL